MNEILQNEWQILHDSASRSDINRFLILRIPQYYDVLVIFKEVENLIIFVQ